MDLHGTEHLFHSLGKYAQQEFGFKKPPTLNLVSDKQNQMKLLGKTAYYDPQNMSISIYVDGRHPKDILRSFAHELVHHTQNENGELETGGYTGQGYAQKNKNLRNMERDAYERGNMCFRDWEDQLKQEKPTIYNERRNYKMSTKKWKNKELSEILSKKFGFKMNLGALNESKEITHMCALHVTHKKSGKEGHPIAHTLTESGDISHYTVEFDDVIVENIAVGDLKILVQEEHHHKRDDVKDHDEKKPVVKEEELDEAAKPDFPDVDGDGDRKEPISKAQKDKKEKGSEKEDKEDDGEEKKEGSKDLSKVPPQLRKHVGKKMKESRFYKLVKEEVLKQLEEVKKKDKPMNSAMISRLKDPKKIKELIDKYHKIAKEQENLYDNKGDAYYDETAEAYYRAANNLKVQLRYLKEKK